MSLCAMESVFLIDGVATRPIMKHPLNGTISLMGGELISSQGSRFDQIHEILHTGEGKAKYETRKTICRRRQQLVRKEDKCQPPKLSSDKGIHVMLVFRDSD